MEKEERLLLDIRQRGAVSIERKVKDIADWLGFTVKSVMWNLGQGIEHGGPHRLDIFINDKSARTYFTDAELLAFGEVVFGEHLDFPAIDKRICAVLAIFDEYEVIPSKSFPNAIRSGIYRH